MRGSEYRGADRRGTLRGHGLDQTYALASALLLAVTAGLGIAASRHHIFAPQQAEGLTSLFRALAAAFAGVGFVLCLLRWRVAGDAAMVWVGAALLVFGVVVMGGAELVFPLLGPTARLRAVIPGTYVAGVLGLLVLLGRGWVAPEVDARLRPRWVMLGALAASGALAVALDHFAPLVSHLVRRGVISGNVSRPVASLWLTVPLVVIGTLYVISGVRGRPVLAWTGTTVLVLALAQLATAAATVPNELWGPAGEALRAAGLLLLVCGLTIEIDRAYRQQGGRLLEVEVARRAAETRTRALRASMSRRRHDVGNALMAIEGAATTLQRHQAALDPKTRDSLTRMLGKEVDRLQRLVQAEEVAGDRHELLTVVHGAIKGLAEPGAVMLEAGAPAPIVGSLSEVSEAVREMLALAVREAGDEPVVVATGVEDGWGIVAVEFVPKGYPQHERRAIIRQRLTGALRGAPGEGLALRFVTTLVREQHGELVLDDADRDDGRMSFRLRLPGPASATADEAE